MDLSCLVIPMTIINHELFGDSFRSRRMSLRLQSIKFPAICVSERSLKFDSNLCRSEPEILSRALALVLSIIPPNWRRLAPPEGAGSCFYDPATFAHASSCVRSSSGRLGQVCNRGC
uniref:(northern house mosquito) hypothetical protein n=1 Tax=Culex pipiens TaxID=7175 RepID=A0A8D8CJ50_CULPI